MSEFNEDFDWQARFIPTIRDIVGPYLIDAAPFKEDAQEATDLLVLNARDMRIACRIRRVGYANFAWDFTVRKSRPNGTVTELEKLYNGFGDWMFYGHAEDKDSIRIARWMLVNLDHWRAHLILHGLKQGGAGIKRKECKNTDGTTFIAYDARSFPEQPPLLIACSHPEELGSAT